MYKPRKIGIRVKNELLAISKDIKFKLVKESNCAKGYRKKAMPKNWTVVSLSYLRDCKRNIKGIVYILVIPIITPLIEPIKICINGDL